MQPDDLRCNSLFHLDLGESLAAEQHLLVHSSDEDQRVNIRPMTLYCLVLADKKEAAIALGIAKNAGLIGL